MTQTLQQALLKAGLVTQDKLKKAEADKKAAQRAHRQETKPQTFQKATPHKGAPHKEAPRKAAPAPRAEEPPRKKAAGFIEGKHHHHIRTNCDDCGRSSPDVEYYEHKNRSLDKYWLCVRCADDHNILDEFRQTMQSSHAIKGVFRRNYGPTKIFTKK